MSENINDISKITKKASQLQFPELEQKLNKTWKENFFFVQAADTQFGLIDHWGEVPVEEQKWNEDIRLTRLAIKHTNSLEPRPKFFIVCGDMINAGPGQKYREEQEKDFVDVFQGLNNEIPLVCVCGNHDVGNSPTVETITAYRNVFGDDYFSFWINSVLFLVLNSQYYEDHSQVPGEYKKQELWLDQQLASFKEGKESGSKEDRPSHCIVFQHIPWFLNTADEPKQYFNIDPPTRMRMLDKLRDAGVTHVFCGHYHRNAGGRYGDLEVVVTSAIGQQIGSDVSGMRLVKVTQDEIQHKYYGLETNEFPLTIDLSDGKPLP